MCRSRNSGLNRSSADLLVVQRHAVLADVLLEAQQALVLGQQAVPAPDPTDAARTDVDALQVELLRRPQPLRRLRQAVVQDGLLDLGVNPVGVGPAGPGQAVDQAVGAVGLEVPADLVELLAAVTRTWFPELLTLPIS